MALPNNHILPIFVKRNPRSGLKNMGPYAIRVRRRIAMQGRWRGYAAAWIIPFAGRETAASGALRGSKESGAGKSHQRRLGMRRWCVSADEGS
jgi:hypothetical protein